MASEKTQTRSARPKWVAQLKSFGRADSRKATVQIFTTLLPYAGLLALMYVTIQQGLPYLVTLVVGVVAAAFLVRTFIIFHDCGHGSFLASRRANRILGTITGILTFTPYDDWRLAHAKHHATAGDLDNRGYGDVYTMTVEEYRAAPRWKQIGYRFFRHPVVMLGFGPPSVFLLKQRVPLRSAGKAAQRSVWITNAALLLIAVVATLTIGLRTYVLIQLPVILMAGTAGIWLFYVQHNYTGVYWARHEAWDPFHAALEGSSYYKLPKLLQWFSGSIGLHHIHHLRATIPNYHLQPAYDAIPEAQAVRPLTPRASLKSLSLRLYDERAGKMVGFREAARASESGSTV